MKKEGNKTRKRDKEIEKEVNNTRRNRKEESKKTRRRNVEE